MSQADAPSPDSQPPNSATPAAISPEATVVDASPAPVAGVPFLTKAGVQLAGWVLAIMVALVAVLIATTSKSEFDVAPIEVTTLEKLTEAATKQYLATGSQETLQLANEFARRTADARKDARAFWVSLFQLLLLNIFLPVLTSILGYVFGTSKAQD